MKISIFHRGDIISARVHRPDDDGQMMGLDFVGKDLSSPIALENILTPAVRHLNRMMSEAGWNCEVTPAEMESALHG